MMPFRLLFRCFILLGGLCLVQLSMAVSLGNLVISSAKNENLEAKISILISSQEARSIGELNAVIAEAAVFDKLSIKRPIDESLPTLRLVKDASGKPSFILLKFSKKSESLEQAFNDLALELSWSSGKITRVYTVLNTQSKEIAVQSGDSLVKITSQLTPNLSGAEFEQVLVALYRLNPNAFYSGNIHRLKAGETLQVPTVSMAASIPQQEARDFTARGYQDYKDKQFTRSTEQGLAQSNKTYQPSKSKEEVKDRLKIGSSEKETEQSVNQAKVNEDMIAQQKMLEEAQQRIAELERNIKDLKELNERKSAKAQVTPSQTVNANEVFTEYGWVLGTLGLAGVFLFGVYRNSTSAGIKPRSMPVEVPVMKEPIVKPAENKEIASPAKVLVFEPKPIVDDKDPPVTISSAAVKAATTEVPPQAQKIFQSIDLNLPSKTELPKPIVTQAKGPFALDLGVEAHDQSTSVAVNTDSLNEDEQRVRLNLAKSYIKIKDIETARTLLSDLMNLGPDIEVSVLEEVKQIMQDLG